MTLLVLKHIYRSSNVQMNQYQTVMTHWLTMVQEKSAEQSTWLYCDWGYADFSLCSEFMGSDFSITELEQGSKYKFQIMIKVCRYVIFCATELLYHYKFLKEPHPGFCLFPSACASSQATVLTGMLTLFLVLEMNGGD